MSTLPAPAPIRVVVVDDDPGIRQGFSYLFTYADSIEVVAVYDDGAQMVEALRLHRPDVALVDIRMPLVDGMSAVRRGLLEGGATRFLLMTAFDVAEDALEAVHAGASGLLLKSEQPAEIVRAVEAVARGEAYYSPRAAEYLTRSIRSAQAPAAEDTAARKRARELVATLTPRERETAELLGSGLQNSEIALIMNLSPHTVKGAISRVVSKLETTNRAGAAHILALAAE